MSHLSVPLPDLQVTFHARLEELRHSLLLDSLLEIVAASDIKKIDRQLGRFAPPPGLQRVAGWGMRGEVVFAVPYLLAQRPRLLGYYRLLLGFSQKQFYGREHGLAGFKSMEEQGRLSPRQEPSLTDLCTCLCTSAAHLVEHVSQLSHTNVHELTLLTLGPQLRGGALNRLGTRATREVFDLIHEIVAAAVTSSDADWIEIKNAAGRTVRIEFSSDPDICIRERLPSGNDRNLVAVEIKGGRDVSNIHNRIGEAEKSHQKARKQGFVECWTIVGVSHLDLKLAHKESPTTDRFFNLDAIRVGEGREALAFREELLSRVGVSD
ncbi:MAG TPA: XcyI family restriction endonuclease [bacterium]